MSSVSGPSGPEQAPAGMAGDLEGETLESRRPLETGTLRYIRGVGTGVTVVGAICLICGVIAVVWPKITLLALAILIGLDLICVGAVSIARAFERDLDSGARALSGVLGLLGVIAGIAVVRRPGDTLLVIVIAVGLFLFGSGIVEIIRALAMPGPRTLALITGAVDVVLAIVILSWPKISLGTLAVLAGIAFILRGALMVYGGIQVRRAAAIT
jgi:uncharacterized membrane protein HdeD (DUF308 family)